MQYSAFTQINKTNVSQLEQVWFYPVIGRAELAFSPLIVGNVMYVAGKGNRVRVALDASTGKEIWTHPTEGTANERGYAYWSSKDGSDRRILDLCTEPQLLTVRHHGKMVDIVAVATKSSLLFVFNRVTGEPLWPIEERPVGKSDVPGEEAWPTQPFPTVLPPISRQTLSEKDVDPYLGPAEAERVRPRTLHLVPSSMRNRMMESTKKRLPLAV
jgi:glucose dehydrogenase